MSSHREQISSPGMVFGNHGTASAQAPALAASTTRWVVVAVGGFAAVGTFCRLLFVPRIFDSVWAEDGAVFLHDAVSAGGSSLLTTYAGYAHTLPRLLAWLGIQLPVATFPAFVAVTSALVVGLLAAFVAAAAGQISGSVASGVVAGLSLALAPAINSEILGNLANLQWFLLTAALWAVVLRGSSSLRWAAASIAGVAAISTPLVLVLFPAALLVHGARTAVRHPAIWTLIAGLLVQAALMWLGPVSSRLPPERRMRIPTDPVHAIVDQIAGHGASTMVAGVFTLFLVIPLVFAWLKAPGLRRTILAVLLAVVLFLGLTGYYAGSLPDRYVAAAFLLGMCAVSLSLPYVPRAGVAVGIAVVVVVIALAFKPVNRQTDGGWSAAADTYQQACNRGQLPEPFPLDPPGWGTLILVC